MNILLSYCFCFPIFVGFFLGSVCYCQFELFLCLFCSVFMEVLIGFTCAVHGIEYAFGAHEYPTTGIFEGEPKKCDGFTFRKSVLIGKTDVGPLEVRTVMEQLAEEYKGNAYNLITKNCNHFCNDACIRLTANPIPSWVNRLARIGKTCFD